LVVILNPDSRMEAQISKKRAVEFVAHQLKVGSVEEVENTLTNGTRSNRLELLNRILRASNREITFQNVYLIAKERCYVPGAEEIIDSGLAMYGGLCYDINPFFNFLFNALGYTSHLIGGQYTASPLTNCHAAVIVKGLDPEIPFDESSHLVDLGCGYPFFEAIPLHRLPRSYSQAGLEYQLAIVDGQLSRLHKRGDSAPEGEARIMVGEWRKVFHFEMEPRKLEFFPPFMKQVYVEDNPFHQSISSVRFPETGLCLVAVKDNELLTMKAAKTIDDSVKMEHVPIDNLSAVYREHFPNIPLEFVQRAVANLTQRQQQS